MKFEAYIIQCVTNMHVGSGDTNYGIVDKMVQRDPVYGYPTIHASSLKGALREHFEQCWGKSHKIDDIFGKEGKDGKDSETGSHRFLGADLVALPIRCTFKQYALAFDSELAFAINNKAKSILGDNALFFKTQIDDKSDKLFGGHGDQYAENINLTSEKYEEPFNINGISKEVRLLNGQYATLKKANFNYLFNHLPVIARNKVGENLWYEEIVPHQTLFITFIGSKTDDEDFNKELCSSMVQIGANASVGYGLCKFYKLDLIS